MWFSLYVPGTSALAPGPRRFSCRRAAQELREWSEAREKTRLKIASILLRITRGVTSTYQIEGKNFI
jgi:hypothetical protein